MNAARTAFASVHVALEVLIHIRLGEWDALGKDWSAEKRQATAQLRHLKRYMRLGQNPTLPDVHRRLGQRVDRALYDSHTALYTAINLVEEHRLAKTRVESVAEYERRREERLERERERRAQREEKERELAARPVAVPKRPKREERPVCEKCGKRPQVSGSLCGPCARWEANR